MMGIRKNNNNNPPPIKPGDYYLIFDWKNILNHDLFQRFILRSIINRL